jgi:hypothetical protein
MENDKIFQKNNNTINLRTDFTESNVSLEKLTGWSCQNFTEILNKPKVIK